MPNIGDVMMGKNIVFHRTSPDNKYIWHACIGCGKQRWVMLISGQPKNLRCHACGCKNSKISINSLDRFESKVEMIPECGCWIWMGAANQNGYGVIHFSGKQYRASRLSWELFNGPIPAGMKACHHCDTPPCVNPYHLFLGTQRENIRDCVAKKRIAVGERHGSAKLIESDIVKIRRDTRSSYEIATDYQVTQGVISRIKTHKIWGYL